MSEDVSYFTFAEEWDDKWEHTRLIWRDDAEYLTEHSIDLNLLSSFVPANGVEFPVEKEEVVWDRAEILEQMINYKLNNLKENEK